MGFHTLHYTILALITKRSSHRMNKFTSKSYKVYQIHHLFFHCFYSQVWVPCCHTGMIHYHFLLYLEILSERIIQNITSHLLNPLFIGLYIYTGISKIFKIKFLNLKKKSFISYHGLMSPVIRCLLIGPGVSSTNIDLAFSPSHQNQSTPVPPPPSINILKTIFIEKAHFLEIIEFIENYTMDKKCHWFLNSYIYISQLIKKMISKKKVLILLLKFNFILSLTWIRWFPFSKCINFFHNSSSKKKKIYHIKSLIFSLCLGNFSIYFDFSYKNTQKKASGRCKILITEEKEIIFGMVKAGETARKVSRELSLPQQTVENFRSQLLLLGSQESCHGQSLQSPRKLKGDDLKQLNWGSTSDPPSLDQQITRRVGADLGGLWNQFVVHKWGWRKFHPTPICVLQIGSMTHPDQSCKSQWVARVSTPLFLLFISSYLFIIILCAFSPPRFLVSFLIFKNNVPLTLVQALYIILIKFHIRIDMMFIDQLNVKTHVVYSKLSHCTSTTLQVSQMFQSHGKIFPGNHCCWLLFGFTVEKLDNTVSILFNSKNKNSLLPLFAELQPRQIFWISCLEPLTDQWTDPLSPLAWCTPNDHSHLPATYKSNTQLRSEQPNCSQEAFVFLLNHLSSIYKCPQHFRSKMGSKKHSILLLVIPHHPLSDTIHPLDEIKSQPEIIQAFEASERLYKPAKKNGAIGGLNMCRLHEFQYEKEAEIIKVELRR
ncbi:hypothetical protein VP01_1671g1 [Puccinia sorghi]|uniref:Uncharacterized protein n=1 Tax=Puccinia sorghi TaxID=27349 RepID=A0A0L6VG73_9BASI|nr:hypothetical protein VP01_1671g1 [Puccinia sorghi]